MFQWARIESPRARRLAVTAAMAVVFAAVMGLAYLTAAVSEARGVRDGEFASPREVVLDGLRVTVPGAWVEDAAAARELGVEAGLLLRDPDRPERWLLLTATRQPRAISPSEQMSRYWLGLLGPEYERLLQPVMPRRAVRREDGLTMLEYVGLSPALRAPGQRLHAMATMTRDGRRHWLIYVTDRLGPGESPAAALERNLALFRRVEQSARFESPLEDPP